jgi:hypothetical protein
MICFQISRHTVDKTSTMDIFDLLKQRGQTAGHRGLQRLLKTRFEQDSDPDQVIDKPLVALRQPFGPLEEHPLGF